ncbi:ABC transporter substrate-binding protein [Halopseudomonas pelagia]|uniref:ABC transporter substrate-binding protein n=1 Tax=Halopseudomonas pelagia TaxID=553151 RepID=UPI0003A20376|nr:ABC transporter substrate-binding protein [Halopseudomonas pelagia]|tara:strand:- start:86019 stop:87020 length:1002 start_codon:yes stop_codon:yes gene_type:complete
MHATGYKRTWIKHTAQLLALLAAAGGANVQAATPITFITNWYAQAEHGGFYQALAEGLYAEKGLDVTIRMGGPQVNSAQLLAAGQAQCIIRDDIGTMMARQQGIPLTMVASSFQYDPTVIITHGDIESLADLKGRSVLISSSAHSSWWPWAKSRYGFTDAMSRPYTFNIQPFMADKSLAQQGYMSSEPFALMNAGADYKVFSLGQEGYPPYGNAVACSDELIAEQPDQVQAFIDASRQGWKNYLTDPAAGNTIIQKENPSMSADQLSFAVEQLRSSGMVTGGDAAEQGISVITDARMQATWNMVVENNLVDADKISLQEVYTTRFVTRNPVLP